MSGVWTTSLNLTAGRPGVRSPLGQGIALFGAVLGLVLLVPLAVLLGAVAVAAFGYFRVRAWLTGLRRPNGVLDGRRNVRVRMPRPDDPDAGNF